MSGMVLIVNGEEVRTSGLTVLEARNEALRASWNLGRPPNDWAVTGVDGRRMGLEEPAEGTAYLSLKSGAGSSHTNHRRKNFPGNRPQCGARSTKEERIRRTPWMKRTARRLERRTARLDDEVVNERMSYKHPDPATRGSTRRLEPVETPQAGAIQLVDDGRWCVRPNCKHLVSIWRHGGFQPAPRGSGRVVMGRPNLCAVVAANVSRGRDEYLTACGDVVSGCSRWHSAPNCPRCRRSLRASGVDHLICWEEGGPSTEANLVTSCKKCNRVRGNTPYEEWLKHPFYLREAAQLDEVTRARNEAVAMTLAGIVRHAQVRSR